MCLHDRGHEFLFMAVLGRFSLQYNDSVADILSRIVVQKELLLYCDAVYPNTIPISLSPYIHQKSNKETYIVRRVATEKKRKGESVREF